MGDTEGLSIDAPECYCGFVTALYASHRVVSDGRNVDDRVGVQLKRISQLAAMCVEERPVCSESADFGRLRFVCQFGFKGGCTFAAWADTQLPQCDCGNGRHAALGRVLSMSANHGRYFAACGMSYNHSPCCKFFRWVKVPSLVAWHQPPECLKQSSACLPCKAEAEPTSVRRWHRGGKPSEHVIKSSQESFLPKSCLSGNMPGKPSRWCRSSASQSCVEQKAVQ